MKKLSEACKIVGVTRRTLQEYDRIGLLKPTSITEAGYWLYDDVAIKKLILIRIFVEADYERKAIKALLESPTLDMLKEYDRLIDTLEKKRKRVDGMINTIKTLKIIAKLPESTLRAMGNIDVSRIYKDKSFASHLEDCIANASEYTEAESAEVELYLPFLYNLIAIGCLMGIPEDSPQVQATVEQSYGDMIEMAKEDEDDLCEYMTKEELAKAFLEFIHEITNDPGLLQMIELQCGEGAAEFIVRAVQVFVDRGKSI
ncbi:MAG: MerR family transcriptional regulator [Lachnospiraceae bacterium]|nr:MerR family transcriptional regulator [Lachnospiraceae bacterium]